MGHRTIRALNLFFPILVIVTVACVRISQAEEELWKNCSVEKTEFVLQFPSSLVPATALPASGCAYQTSDGEFNVEAVEQTDAAGRAENLNDRMQKESKTMAGTLTNQEQGESWFTLSGVTSDGTEYFRKHFTNGAKWVTLRMTFPHAKRKKYDKWVKQIEKTFVPFGKPADKSND